MGFFSSGPDDNYADLYIKITPGATKAGGKAKYKGMMAFIGQLHDYRRKKAIEDYPTATKDQIDVACRAMGAKERELMEAMGYDTKLKEWRGDNQRLETIFWEDVANGRQHEGSLSPEEVFDMSFYEAIRAPKPIPQEEVIAAHSSGPQDMVSKIKQLKDLLDADLISQDEFDAKKKDLLSNL